MNLHRRKFCSSLVAGGNNQIVKVESLEDSGQKIFGKIQRSAEVMNCMVCLRRSRISMRNLLVWEGKSASGELWMFFPDQLSDRRSVQGTSLQTFQWQLHFGD